MSLHGPSPSSSQTVPEDDVQITLGLGGVRSGQDITGKDLSDFRANVLEKDDVFQPSFYTNILFHGSQDPYALLTSCARDELAKWNSKDIRFPRGDPRVSVPPGPYVFTAGKTWQPWRTYYDTNACFMTSFKPSLPGNLVAVDASIAGLNGRVVVPSRCYYTPSPLRPLHGARIAVKDNIDIAGHKTSLCNRAWMDLYPPKTKHAACVQTLVDAGAVIVGKVKLQAMIMREEPLECVEFTAPFNPRADGYQVLSGSSHVSATSIASYDLLDFTFGSDTNGSGRKPASYNGCFSIRPSTGITDNEGVVGYFPQFDMPVFSGRDISKFPDFISTWYGDSPMPRPAPDKAAVTILYPSDYLPTPNHAQTIGIDKFASGLELTLGVERTKISLSEQWKRDMPDGPEHTDIAAYLETAGIYPFYHDQYHNSADFREQYKQKFGKPPFVHRALHWQCDIGRSISQEDRAECWRRSELYRHWLLERVFDADSKDSVTIMVLPIEAGQPSYRDAEIPAYSLLGGYAALNMSPMMRTPEVTALVGDIPYFSTVTEREERLPIAVSVIGPPGADLILVDLVEKALNAGGIPTEVKTGRFMH